MPAAFPHVYETELNWEADRHGSLGAEGCPSITVGPPPQFDGKEGLWSPETLLMGSVQLCLMTTFLAIASRSGSFSLQDYRSRIRGVLEKTTEGIVFTSIRMEVSLRSNDAVTARDLLLKAKKYCIISNALKVPVELEVDSV